MNPDTNDTRELLDASMISIMTIIEPDMEIQYIVSSTDNPDCFICAMFTCKEDGKYQVIQTNKINIIFTSDNHFLLK